MITGLLPSPPRYMPAFLLRRGFEVPTGCRFCSSVCKITLSRSPRVKFCTRKTSLYEYALGGGSVAPNKPVSTSTSMHSWWLEHYKSTLAATLAQGYNILRSILTAAIFVERLQSFHTCFLGFHVNAGKFENLEIIKLQFVESNHFCDGTPTCSVTTFQPSESFLGKKLVQE